MSKFRFIGIIILIFVAVVNAYSYDDGFGQAKKFETKHFTVYYSPQLDVYALAKNLGISFSDRVLAGTDPKFVTSSGQPDLADSLDTLFLGVSSILDMNIYSFKCTIKICRDQNQLNSIYEGLFNTPLGGRYSFYVSDLHTIYISQDHFDRGVLGHEIAHAVIDRFFVVQPPVKASEVLSGYVEYQLRKNTDK